MRLIDADVLEPHEHLEQMGNGYYEYVEVVYKDDIDDVSTIDAVPVVRCKDCIHQEHCHETVAHTRHHDDFIEYWSETIEWCSRGERKGGDTE